MASSGPYSCRPYLGPYAHVVDEQPGGNMGAVDDARAEAPVGNKRRQCCGVKVR